MLTSLHEGDCSGFAVNAAIAVQLGLFQKISPFPRQQLITGRCREVIAVMAVENR
jgi:hypothetical protein